MKLPEGTLSLFPWLRCLDLAAFIRVREPNGPALCKKKTQTPMLHSFVRFLAALHLSLEARSDTWGSLSAAWNRVLVASRHDQDERRRGCSSFHRMFSNAFPFFFLLILTYERQISTWPSDQNFISLDYPTFDHSLASSGIYTTSHPSSWLRDRRLTAVIAPSLP